MGVRQGRCAAQAARVLAAAGLGLALALAPPPLPSRAVTTEQLLFLEVAPPPGRSPNTYP
jgi:hypothetical protein